MISTSNEYYINIYLQWYFYTSCSHACLKKALDSFIGNFLQLRRPQKDTFDPIPDCHERDSQEETKTPTKLCYERFKRVDQDLIFNLGKWGHSPEAKQKLIFWRIDLGEFFRIDNLILLVATWSFAASQLHHLR